MHPPLCAQADTTGQRGFRRRCLDFDASVARRKSLGSMGGRKSLGSRFKDSGGSSSPADDSNPSSVLTDRVAATSDATTSGMPAPIHDLSNANESFRSESNSGGAPARGKCWLYLPSRLHRIHPECQPTVWRVGW